MTRVEDKVKQLHQSHKSHLARPTLDDVSQEEAEIQTQTKEVTEVILDATIIPFVANMIFFFKRKCFECDRTNHKNCNYEL